MTNTRKANQARRTSQTHGFTPTHAIDQTLRVDVVDMLGDGMRDTAFLINTNNSINRANPTIMVAFRPDAKADRFDAFATQIIESVSMMERSISVLRLWAHAYVDSAHRPIGDAILGDKPFTAQHVSLRHVALARLKPYFSRHPATRFEFRGCGVANAGGLDLMTELARLWGIRVHAAKVNQDDGMNWVGTVVEALPDGTRREIGGVRFDSPF